MSKQVQTAMYPSDGDNRMMQASSSSQMQASSEQDLSVKHSNDDLSAYAVRFEDVTKTFEQWQRSGKGMDILKNLLKSNKKTVTALDRVSFEVKKGEFVAYAGPNGAGKSTTMKLLCGMLVPAGGDIRVLGKSPRKDRVSLLNRIGVVFGNRTELWWDHPVLQSFEWKRVVWDIPKERYERMMDAVTQLLDLKEILHTFARELSLGQRMKADLAMLLLHEPELILLDEPTIGLDVLAKQQIIRFLKDLNREKGTTVMVTSHDMDDLEDMAHRILLISKGKIAFDGSFDALRRSTGAGFRLSLTASGETPPEIGGAALISTENGIFTYAFDDACTSMKEIFSQIAGYDHISDVEIKKAPIEDVIGGLYRAMQ